MDNYRTMGTGCDNLMQTCQKANDALDAAAEVCFKGNMLNCMSMGEENTYQRPISGGPVYVSDEVGAIQPEQLWPLIEDDGACCWILLFLQTVLPAGGRHNDSSGI